MPLEQDCRQTALTILKSMCRSLSNDLHLTNLSLPQTSTDWVMYTLLGKMLPLPPPLPSPWCLLLFLTLFTCFNSLQNIIWIQRGSVPQNLLAHLSRPLLVSANHVLSLQKLFFIPKGSFYRKKNHPEGSLF